MDFYREKFKLIRKQKKLSMQVLAEMAGISRESVSIWERGIREPNQKYIRQLAHTLEVDVSEISDMKPELPFSKIELSSARDSWMGFVADSDDLNKKIDIAQNTINLLREELNQIKLILKAITSTLDSIFYIKDKNCKYVIANDAFLKNISYLTKYKVLGKTDSDFFSAREADINTEEDKIIIEKGSKIINREDYIPGTRKKKIALKSKIPIFDSRGHIAGMVAFYTDITQQKETEKHRILLEKVINGVDCYIAIIKDLGKHNQFKLVFINDYTFVNAFNQNISQQKSLTDLWKELAPKHYYAFVNHISTNKEFPISYERKGINPKTKQPMSLLEKIYKPLEDYYFIISHDITEVKNLKEGRKMLLSADNILSNTVLWGGILDKNKTDIWFNFASDNVVDIIGYNSNEFESGKLSMLQFVPQQFKQLFHDWLNRLDKTPVLEHWVEKNDGSMIWCETRVDLEQKDGVTYCIGTTTDSSKSEEAKKPLMDAQEATLNFFVNQKLAEVARKMKNESIDIHTISKCTDLPAEELEKL